MTERSRMTEEQSETRAVDAGLQIILSASVLIEEARATNTAGPILGHIA